jgi:hypothetical protein
MTEIINLPNNFIGKEDCEKLESFGGHTIAHGRATYWHWAKDAEGNDVFEIYRGGEHETLTARISRDRQLDAFRACDATGGFIASGALERVFAELEVYFTRLHGEEPDVPA